MVIQKEGMKEVNIRREYYWEMSRIKYNQEFSDWCPKKVPKRVSQKNM